MATTARVTERPAIQTRAFVWRDVAISVSFANLCYLRVWSELLTWSQADAYTMKLPFTRAAYAAAMVNVLLVAAAALAALTLARRAGRRVHRVLTGLGLLLLALPLNAVRGVLSNRFELLRSPLFGLLGTRGVVLLAAAVCIGGIVVLWRFSGPASRLAGSALFLLSPLAAMTFGQSIWRISSYDASAFADQPSAPPLAGAHTLPRVLWVILDEWDQRLTFQDRPSGLVLPEIDRFRRESLYAANAYSPGPETPISMPALITGRMVRDVIRRGPSELRLVYPDGGRPQRFGGQPNIFTDARAAGFNTALVGWYHPYCRELGSAIVHCAWWPMDMQYNTTGNTLGELIPGQTRSLFETSLFSLFGQSLSTRGHARTYRTMMGAADQVLSDPRYGLTLLHLPTPHPPHPYNRRTGRFDLANSPFQGYIDSLALADRTVGELRRTLVGAGLWNRTTVLLSTDHSYRSAEAVDGKKDHRIPFLLKFAGQNEPLEFTPAFNTLLTRDLVGSILRGEVATPAQAASWLNAHRTIADSPYNHN